jgi:hypothetical protein
MSRVCTTCSRINPVDAVFCYFDGVALGGPGRNGGAVQTNTQHFRNAFVFPSGATCRNFDELALACQQNWQVARELLQKGRLESFLGSVGRTDLAQAAREAARFPDRDRGLDQLLGKFPSTALQPPSLSVEPLEINLGVLPIGQDRHVRVRLHNQGMRLLYGSIACEDCVWLTVGEAPGAPRKIIQFDSDLALPVHVVGKHLRAGNKPLEGRLVIESNGGTATVVVRAQVPVKPFPEGALAGAISPRQIAEKAKAAPRDAAILFENGAVERWYKDNGWTYPVQGPAASGISAVQQFFEALGLTTPPKVEISERAVHLRGNAGDKIEHALKVQTQEKRPVYAHATSDQPWLKVGRAILEGRSATIPLEIPAVPSRPGERLQCRITVTANGNQRFWVPVVLMVGGRPNARPAELMQEAMPVLELGPTAFGRGQAPVAAVPVLEAAPVAAVPVLDPWDAITAEPLEASFQGGAPEPVRRAVRRDSAGGLPWWAHLIPIAVLLLALVGVMARDFRLEPTIIKSASVEDDGPAKGGDGPVDGPLDSKPRIALRFHDDKLSGWLGTSGLKPREGDPDTRGIEVWWEPSMRFGLEMLMEKDPAQPGQFKRLTFKPEGLTNNTVLKLDGEEHIFGEKPFKRKSDGKYAEEWPGQWKKGARDLPIDHPEGERIDGKKSVWVYDQEKVVITQTVQIIRGPQSRLLDTCLVRYLIENQDNEPHSVGLRFLLDTYIGSNDGVPFLIPGKKKLISDMMDFPNDGPIPDFIQALEHEDLEKPGTIAQVQLKLGSGAEPPSRVTLGAWPNPILGRLDRRCQQEKTGWEVPVLPIHSMEEANPPGKADSAVTIYWDPKVIKPGKSREVGFTYGLGNVASKEGGGKLALTAGGSFKKGDEFTLTAYVSKPTPGQTVELTLPEGLERVGGDQKQTVPPVPPGAASRNSPVTWKIKGAKEGTHTIKVQSSNGAKQTLRVIIRTKGLFD